MNFLKFTKGKLALSFLLFLCAAGLLSLSFGCSWSSWSWFCPIVTAIGLIIMGPALFISQVIFNTPSISYLVFLIVLSAVWVYILASLVIWLSSKMRSKSV